MKEKWTPWLNGVFVGLVAQVAGDGSVAEFGQVGIVQESVGLQPPLTEERRDERRDETADVDEDIEDLEAGVPLLLGRLQGLGAFLGRFDLIVVVHLADDGLEISLEQAVAEGDQGQGQAGEGKQPCGVGGRGRDGDGQEDVTRRHDDQALLDGALVVLGAVGDDAAHQGEHIDGGVEDGVDQAAGRIAESELGDEEQQQDRIHDVVAEAFAHVAERGGKQSFRVVFEHVYEVLRLCGSVSQI